MSSLAVPSSSSVSPAVNLQVRLADLAGEKFKDMFYSIFDSHRSDLPRFFSPSSLVVWEGNSVTGSQQLSHLFSLLPPTKHTLTSCDTHPIQHQTAAASSSSSSSASSASAASSSSPTSLLVSVSGTVVYGLDTAVPRGFFHSFVIEKAAASGFHYIVSAAFRSRQLTEPDRPKKHYKPSH